MRRDCADARAVAHLRCLGTVTLGSVGRHSEEHLHAGAPQVQRLIFVSAGFNESNRFWTITRPQHLQFDPFLETLLDLDPKTGDYIPRLAEKWESSPDQKEWTFYLRKGVPFHFGYGEFTAKDVVHSHSLMLREEAIATLVGFWRNAEEVKAVDDYHGGLPHEEPGSHHALCGFPLGGSADREQGPVG